MSIKIIVLASFSQYTDIAAMKKPAKKRQYQPIFYIAAISRLNKLFEELRDDLKYSSISNHRQDIFVFKVVSRKSS